MLELFYMSWAKKQKGFTIVELLIVVVVIAILAAITIVAFNGVSNRAKESAAKTSALQADKKVKQFATLNAEALPDTLEAAGLSSTNGMNYQYTVTGTNGFCVTASKDNVAAYVANNYTYNGGTLLTQTTPANGACPGHSVNGGTIIKNLATNPSYETGTTGWSGSAGASIATSTGVWADSGTTSVRITNTTTTNQGDFRISNGANTMPFGMEPGKTYTISARLYFTAAPTGALGRAPGILYWYSTNGAAWNEQFGPKAPTTPGTYTVSHTVTVPANATGVLIAFGAASSTVSQNFYYDSFMITEGSTAYNYGDGSSANWVWLGTPNASASTGPSS